MDILIQVNTSKEESKFGVDPDSALELVGRISQLSYLHIKGLMTICLLSDASKKVRDCFKLLKAIQLEIASKNIPGVYIDELSMGMSGDLEICVLAGNRQHK